MYARWFDFDTDWSRSSSLLDRMWSQMDAMWRELDRPMWRTPLAAASRAWPATNLHDTGDDLVLTAAVPGLREQDIELTLTGDVLTMRGQRTISVPEGYSVRRQERPSTAFERSFFLPTRIDAERVEASVKDGVLTVRLPKAADARPRQIPVKAS